MIERTLRYGQDYKDKWYPIYVHIWEPVLSQIKFRSEKLLDSYEIRRNLAYNLQYLEYLQQTLQELSLSAVLEKLTYKTYIVTAIGIVECIFFHIVKASGRSEGKLVRILKALESRELFGSDPRVYADLHKFRRLRNKVHIHDANDEVGTDYSSFGRDEYEEMRQILDDLFASEVLMMSDESRDTFSFLKLDERHTES